MELINKHLDQCFDTVITSLGGHLDLWLCDRVGDLEGIVRPGDLPITAEELEELDAELRDFQEAAERLGYPENAGLVLYLVSLEKRVGKTEEIAEEALIRALGANDD